MHKFILFNIVLITGIIISSNVFSQYYFYNEDYYYAAVTWEAGFSAGGMNCLTDLGGKKGPGKKFIKDVNWHYTRPCGSLYASIDYLEVSAARLELSFGQVAASDHVLANDRSEGYGRFLRNLNFRTTIREFSFTLECYPFSIIKPTGTNLPSFNPYIIAGVGSFSFRPETFYNNSWINVSALHTEGQGFAEYPDRKLYKLTQLNMPVGFGLKYELSPVICTRFEIMYRKLWTDYLDDVSKTYIDPALFARYFSAPKAGMALQLADRSLLNNSTGRGRQGEIRGNDKNNDAYFSFNIKFGVVFGRQRRLGG